MQLGNIIKIVVLVVLVVIVYKFSKKPILIYVSKLSLPEEVTSYKSITEASLASENYEMIKLFKGHDDYPAIKDFFYDFINKNHYIKTFDKSEDACSDCYIYWRLNNRGDITDSISVASEKLFNSGVFFYDDYYVDWFNTGDRTKKNYIEVIEDTTLTRDQIKTYIKDAKALDAGVDYSDFKDIKIDLFIFNGEGWSVIKSKKLYNEIVPVEEENDYESKGKEQLHLMKDAETFSLKLESYFGSFKKRYTLLTRFLPTFLEDKSKGYSFEVVAFEKIKYFEPSKFSFADVSYGPPGWYGIGYVTLNYGSEPAIPFKLEAIEYENGIETGINIYYPEIETGEALTFASISAKRNREDSQDYYGLYIIRPKHLSTVNQ